MENFNKTVGRAINADRAALAEAITARHYEIQPELETRYGAVGRAKCVQDAGYHLSYLAEAISASSPALFADYIAWAKVMLESRGVPAGDLSRNLNCIREVLQQRLTPCMSVVTEQYIEAALSRLPQSPSDIPTHFDEVEPHAELAKQFVTLLLQGDRHAASRLILDTVSSGVTVQDIYLYVFQRSQRELGRLWQMNQLSVAQEHYCTAATQFIMSQLYPYIFRTEKNGCSMVATSVSGELHEIGMRIVADFLEMEGWDTYYLGANTPAPGILQCLQERKAQVLGISATMTFHVGAVENLIAAVRASEAVHDVKILVGGYPFNIEPDLWRRVGADGYAKDASEAITAANQFCG
jgi:methanogenic corrinoid protein MtbC1